MQQTIISNKNNLASFKKTLAKEGTGKFLVAADFDRTFTEGWMGQGATACPLTGSLGEACDQRSRRAVKNCPGTLSIPGKRAPSLISILRDEPGYLTPDYAQKAKALADKYHPIELDLTIPKKEKLKAMDQWWTKAFELLIVSGFEKKDLEKAVMSKCLKIRRRVKEFLLFLKKNDVPLIFISASGLGVESIKIFLEKRGLYSQNIKIVSNNFIWNEQGKAIAYKEPIVHTLNKGGVDLKHFGITEKILKRKNVLLVGDSIDDIDMAKPFEPKNLLKIGFLDFDIQERLSVYKSVFDVILLNNSPFDFINKLLNGSTKTNQG
ncbi:MAG: hypothetical protein AUJ25_02320 [Parcubacteria group bacterium CG1_02_37_13]|nr:MAG: hypothetical protein AUJ25_02320 [Parcubacteria group bacterium CG1_02_37_13]